MKTGDQILVHNPFNPRKALTYLSWLIRVVCGVFYNHAAIVLVINGVVYIVEATFPKVKITRYDEWQKKYKRVIQHDPIDSKFSEEELQYRIISQIGKSYDSWSLLMILKYLLTGRWRGRRGRKAAKRLYCFELVAHVHDQPEFWKVIPAI